MGYDLSAALGYGVKLRSYENNDGLLDNLDYDEDDLDSEDFRLVYAGTDDCTETFLLLRKSIDAAHWYGYDVELDNLRKFSDTKILLRNHLEDNGIQTKLEDYKWWLLPRWF